MPLFNVFYVITLNILDIRYQTNSFPTNFNLDSIQLKGKYMHKNFISKQTENSRTLLIASHIYFTVVWHPPSGPKTKVWVPRNIWCNESDVRKQKHAWQWKLSQILFPAILYFVRSANRDNVLQLKHSFAHLISLSLFGNKRKQRQQQQHERRRMEKNLLFVYKYFCEYIKSAILKFTYTRKCCTILW